MLSACKRPVTPFSVLGWETALVVATIYQQYPDGSPDGEDVAGYLTRTVLESPRGTLRLDPATHYYTAPAARFRLEAGAAAPETVWLPDLREEWEAFTALVTEGAVTGWTNTYLCY